MVWLCMRYMAGAFEYVQAVSDDGEKLITTHDKSAAQSFREPNYAMEYCGLLDKGGFEGFSIEPYNPTEDRTEPFH